MSFGDQKYSTLPSTDSEPIAVVCAADNCYAIPLAVMLYSLVSHLQQQKNIVIFVIDGGISWWNKKKIIRSLHKFKQGLSLQWLNPKKSGLFSDLCELKVSHYITVTAYYRLLIPYLLPKALKKVIYLDSDLLIQEDLSQLWKIELGDNYLLAVQDMGAPYVSSPYGLSNYQELGIPADYKYFNSGVMAINLNKWKAENISIKIIEYLTKYPEYLRWWDQDGLNAILANKWGEIDPRWNQIPHIYSYKRWQESPFSEATYKAIISSPYIIHFATRSKPWNFKINYKPSEKLFFQYLDRTAWSGWRPKEAFNSRLNRYWNRIVNTK
jgi:lipopolysaccharide biosynthesis glycosyltransferase